MGLFFRFRNIKKPLLDHNTMKKSFRTTSQSGLKGLILLGILCLFFTGANAAVRFSVTLDRSVAAGDQSVSGRLLIFMTRSDKPLEMIEPDFEDPNAVWISGTEVANLEPGKAIEIDADATAFPGGFSTAPSGDYQVFALLDRDHSYTYNGAGPGDIYSSVVKSTMPAAETAITLSKVISDRKIEVPPNARLIEFESPMLSAFWGRPIKMEATVILPPSYNKSKTQRYPTVYNVSGYGGTHLNALRGAAAREKEMLDGKRPEMIGGKPLIFMRDSVIPPESCETPSVRGDQTCGDLT